SSYLIDIAPSFPTKEVRIKPGTVHRDWVKNWNDNPKPFVWTKTAEDILESLGRLMKRINGAGH
ncbi:MAG: hypothetical protein ACXWEI_22825, partial [Mycobacterium sp.]